MFHKIELLNKSELLELNKIFNNADFSNGKMNERGTHEKKNNLEMDFDQYYNNASSIIASSINNSEVFQQITNFKKNSSFLFSKYIEGMFYKKHYDDVYMEGKSSGRSDYSCTVFLNDPSEYEGGELSIDFGSDQIDYKLKAGEAVVYPTGFAHQVKQIKSGTRKVCVFWIECRVQNLEVRNTLSKFHKILFDKREKINNLDKDLLNDLYSLTLDLERSFGDCKL